MNKREQEAFIKFLCAAYDGTPMTIHRSKRGKIVDVEVHDTETEAKPDRKEGGKQ